MVNFIFVRELGTDTDELKCIERLLYFFIIFKVSHENRNRSIIFYYVPLQRRGCILLCTCRSVGQSVGPQTNLARSITRELIANLVWWFVMASRGHIIGVSRSKTKVTVTFNFRGIHVSQIFLALLLFTKHMAMYV